MAINFDLSGGCVCEYSPYKLCICMYMYVTEVCD